MPISTTRVFVNSNKEILQFLKAKDPIYWSLLGKSICFNFEHSSKHREEIDVKPSQFKGISTLSRFWLCANALVPKEVIVLGRVTLVMLL